MAPAPRPRRELTLMSRFGFSLVVAQVVRPASLRMWAGL